MEAEVKRRHSEKPTTQARWKGEPSEIYLWFNVGSPQIGFSGDEPGFQQSNYFTIEYPERGDIDSPFNRWKSCQRRKKDRKHEKSIHRP